MASPNDQGGDRSSERMGRGVKEGLNAGQSRNAHDSGSRGGMQGESSDRGRGGYGDDSGFTGGARAARDDDSLEQSSPRAGAPGSEAANVEDHSRIDGVGHQAPSGMDERESSGETR